MTDWKKRAENLMPRVIGFVSRVGSMETAEVAHAEVVRVALQLGQEMADARAEEIAKMLSVRADEFEEEPDFERRFLVGELRAAAIFIRNTISKPKTREQVLEEALRLGERMFRDTLWAKTAREALGESESQEEFHL